MTAAGQTEGSRFSRNKLGKKTGGLLVLGFISVMLVTTGISQTSSGTPTVSIGDNGIQVNGGGIDMGGTDISDGGTVIWDASEGFVPESSLPSGIGSDGYLPDNPANSSVDMNSNQINNLADPTNAQDAATQNWVNTNDDFEADTNANTECSGTNTYLSGDGTCETDQYEADTDNQDLSDVLSNGNTAGSNDIEMNDNDVDNVYTLGGSGAPNQEIIFGTDASISVYPDTNGRCQFQSGGDLDCDGDISAASKNFVQSINSTHNAVYTSQESPEARAVVEDSVYIDGRTTVELPKHFTQVTSDTQPDMNVQVTAQGTVTAVGVIEESNEKIVIDANKATEVDYRVSAVREGYEDKQVVRPKEEQ